MHRNALAPLALVIALLTPAAQAQSAPARDDTLYQAFGGQPGLVALMDDFVPRLFSDPRLQPFFARANAAHLKEQLVLQLCEVAGGPCTRNGPSMATAHADMDIGKADFNALVEDLQLAMDARGIPFATQNRMLARLAPMHRDIITR